MNAEASSSNAGPPPALVIGDTGLYSYKSIKDSDGTAEAHWPGEDDPSGLPQPASDAEGLQFDDLINAVECGPPSGFGSLEFAGSLAGNKFKPERYSFTSALKPNQFTTGNNAFDSEQATPSSSQSPEDAYHSCISTPPSTISGSAPDKLQLVVLGIPAEGMRTRVETQIRITFALLQPKSSAIHLADPFSDLLTLEGDLSAAALQHCRLAKRWNYIKLPAFAAIKRKHKKHLKTDASTENSVSLEVKVVKSNSDEQVLICNSCQERERKRAQRKKDPKVKPEPEADQENGEEISPDDPRRIVLFNCGQHLDFHAGQVSVPTRIACYCRHHKEKDGFRLACTLHDDSGQVLAETMSRTIFTTDDHKARPRASNGSSAGSAPPSRNVTSENLAALAKEQSSQNTPISQQDDRKPSPFLPKVEDHRTFSDPAQRRSSKDHSGRSLRSEKPYDSAQRPQRAGLKRTPSGLSHPRLFAMTPLDTPQASPSSSAAPSPHHTSFHHQQQHTGVPSFGGFEMPSFHSSAHQYRAPQMDQPEFVSMQEVSRNPSAPVSRQPQDHSDSAASPGPSADSASVKSSLTSQDIHDMALDASPYCPPNNLDPAAWSSPQTPQVPLPEGLPAVHHERPQEQAAPKIGRIVPNEGPISGGIEVTILGQNLRPDMVCLFGDAPALSTQLWSSNTLVCIAPAGASPGPVIVTIKDQPVDLSSGVQLFTYVDSSDRAMMELALQVVGLKMTGKLEGARDVALRIISNTNHAQPQNPADDFNPADYVSTAANQLSPLTPAAASDYEGSILRLLALLDHPLADHTPADLPTIEGSLALRDDRGQGLLHLAAILGFHRLASFCLVRGADPNILDRNCFSPLHFAALHGRVTIARVLVQAGASTFIRNGTGKTAYDIALERHQPDIVTLLPTPTRAPRASVQHSRRSSRSSLFSFFTNIEDESDADPSVNASRDDASDIDSEAEDGNDSDLESRLSRAPSTSSLTLYQDQASEPVASQPAPGVISNEEKQETKGGVQLADLAAAYSGWIHRIGDKLPHSPTRLQVNAALRSPFQLPPPWAEKLSNLPVGAPRVDDMKAWFHKTETEPQVKPKVAQEQPRPRSGSLSSFNPPSGHFWRPFDVLNRGATGARQIAANAGPSSESLESETEHTYPPLQAEADQVQSTQGWVRDRLARRLGYIPRDINDNVLRAMDYHRSKYMTLRRRRVFFVFVLPMLLLALAWLFYGGTYHGIILETILRPSSILSQRQMSVLI